MADDRRDDWHNSVDERLVNLTSAQKSADADLDKLRDDWEELDLILRGDPTSDTEGLIEAVNSLRNEINKFNRIFDKDYSGHGGLVAFITYVHDREKDRQEERRESRGYKWAFWGLIASALIGAAMIALTSRDQIEKWWARPVRYEPSAELRKEIEADKKRMRAKAAKKAKAQRPKPVTVTEASDEPAVKDVP